MMNNVLSRSFIHNSTVERCFTLKFLRLWKIHIILRIEKHNEGNHYSKSCPLKVTLSLISFSKLGSSYIPVFSLFFPLNSIFFQLHSDLFFYLIWNMIIDRRSINFSFCNTSSCLGSLIYCSWLFSSSFNSVKYPRILLIKSSFFFLS